MALAIVVVAGAVIRLVGIGDKSLWIDEVFSLWISDRPPVDIVRISADLDFHPPLYYLLLHLWNELGLSAIASEEEATRLLSLLFGLAVLPLVYLIGARIGGRALGLCAAGILAISPLNLYYAHQVRMYTMLTCFAATAVWCLQHVLEPRPVRRPDRWWFGLVLSTALVLLSHDTGALMSAAVVVYLLTEGARRGLLRNPTRANAFAGLTGALTAQLAAVLLWLPWLPSFIEQVRRVDAAFWISPPTVATVVDFWVDLASAYTQGPGRIVAGVAAALLVGLGVLRGRHTPGIAMMAVLLMIPPAVELLVSLRRPVFYTQTMIWTSIPFSVLAAAGLLAIRPSALRLAAGALVAVYSALGIVGVHEFPGKEDWRSATAYVAARAGYQELVLFSAGWSQLPFDHYYPHQGGPPLVRDGLPADLFDRHVLEPKMTPADVPRLETLVAQHNSFWVVYSHDWYTDATEIVPAALRGWTRVDGHDFPGIRVVRYASPP
jgi:4-amino-4-deoxy-L-arabinose transferase-like glycosyltransferase